MPPLDIINTGDYLLQNSRPFRVIGGFVTVNIDTLNKARATYVRAKDTTVYAPEAYTLKVLVNEGFDDGYPVPSTYQWEYITEAGFTSTATWNVIPGNNSETLVVPRELFTTHLGAFSSSNTSVLYRCRLLYGGIPNSNLATQVSQNVITLTEFREANTVPVAEATKSTVLLPTTALQGSQIIDFSGSGFDVTVRADNTYYGFVLSGPLLPKQFRYTGTTVFSGMATVGGFQAIDTNKDNDAGTLAADTCRFLNFVEDALNPTQKASVLKHNFEVCDGSGDISNLTVTQSVYTVLGGAATLVLDNPNGFAPADFAGLDYVLGATLGGNAYILSPDGTTVPNVVFEVEQSPGVFGAYSVKNNGSFTSSGLKFTLSASGNSGATYSLSAEGTNTWTSDTESFNVRATYTSGGQTVTLYAIYNVQKVRGGESGVDYDVEITSTNGTVFRVGQSTTTTLKARVFRNAEEVTDLLPASAFKWSRVSGIPQPPPNDDATWNNLLNLSRVKEINLSVDDVYARATFFCEIIIP